MVACFGLPRTELGDLDQIIGLSRREVDMINSWSSPAGWTGAEDPTQPPPGLGKCLLKVGGRPGVPVKIQITATERRLHDTDPKFEPVSGRSAANSGVGPR